MPEGTIGWWYYISAMPVGKYGFATSPEQACALNAANHFGSKLFAMVPESIPTPGYSCWYKHGAFKFVENYSDTNLFCKLGYVARWPGVCTKQAEIPQPPACKNSEPGKVVGNPVVLSSGAKLQSETDFLGLENGLLRVVRTYRTLRQTGNAQSAGRGWSFSFDREFLTSTSGKHHPYTVRGSLDDGSYFEFTWRSAGGYRSSYGQHNALQSMNDSFDDWVLTTGDSNIDRFQKIGEKYLLVSSQTKEGPAQYYTYGADGHLTSISDGNGRHLTVTWEGDHVASIANAEGSVHYQYAPLTSAAGEVVAGPAQLIAVQFHDDAGQVIGSKTYHYEDPDFSDLLTGITDENGARFATYAYNRTGQVVLSEHAGGVDRYNFSYPEKTRRSVIDSLGTKREYLPPYYGQSPRRRAKTMIAAQKSTTYMQTKFRHLGWSLASRITVLCGDGTTRIHLDFSRQMKAQTEYLASRITHDFPGSIMTRRVSCITTTTGIINLALDDTCNLTL